MSNEQKDAPVKIIDIEDFEEIEPIEIPEQKVPVNYIDKEEFSTEMDVHAKECRKARTAGEPMPKCPESIGEKFLLIAQNVATKGNFSRYSYRDEMIADAVENMLRYRYNYRKDRGHAFSYFTQFTMYAFIRRIKKENEQLNVKAKAVQQIALHEVIPHMVQDSDSDIEFRNEYVSWLIERYEQKLPEKKKRKKRKVKKDED